MLLDQRQLEMAEWIMREGRATVSDLAEHFAVSSETVRRDLNVICTGGKIKKVHGGAVAVRGTLVRDGDYTVRREKHVRQKREIGRRAARLLCDNDVIAMDSGTCTEAMAREIYGVHNLCVITASLPLASVLAQKLGAGDFDGRVIFLGGTVSPEGQNTCGVQTVAELKKYSIDKAFLGATAVSAKGVMVWNENDGHFTSALIEQAQRSYILAESQKLGGRSFYLAAPLSGVALLLTDDLQPMGAEMREAVKAAGLEVELVSLQRGVDDGV